MTRRFSLPGLLLAGLVLGVGGDAQEAGDAASRDARLVAAVRVAAEKGVAPDKVERAVGRKATLNTLRAEDRGPFSRADIVPDPDRQPPLPPRESLRWVAYWVRPVESRNPKIVGIFWPREGKARVFFGEILPPG